VKVSIITATFNNCETIVDSLNSTISQQGAEFELIVIDGGSTDGTIEVLDGIGGQIDTLVSESDDGMYDALNKGIARASGDIVGFMHSDDLFSDSNVLSDVVSAFADPEVVVAYGDLHYVGQSDPNRIIRRWRAGNFSSRKLAWGWMPPHPTLYLRRSLYEQVGGFNTQYRIAADYDHILRVFSLPNLKPVYIPRVLVKMRTGGQSNSSIRNVISKSKEDFRVIKKNNVGGIGTLLWKNISKIPQFF
jgi:glycosyltransferase involved in cell wall biosynthesis